MARTDSAKVTLTKAEIAAMIAEAIAEDRKSTPRASAASSHWTEQDIPCSSKRPCDKTFRTVKGRDWHVANVKH